MVANITADGDQGFANISLGSRDRPTGVFAYIGDTEEMQSDYSQIQQSPVKKIHSRMATKVALELLIVPA